MTTKIVRKNNRAVDRNLVYRTEKWGKQLRREGALTSNISAMRTETMPLPTPLSLPATNSQLSDISLTQYKLNTPINLAQFEQELSKHPNRPLVEWALSALRFGVRTGYNGNRSGYEHSNLKSAAEQPAVLRDNIQKELEAGRLLGPSTVVPTKAKISPLGIVPKLRSDKFRTINHLSFPYGSSVNDGQDDDDLHTEYDLVGVTLDWVRHHGKGCWIMGGDVENAFRIIPVHPADILLQYFKFEGKVYGDTNLVFGMRSSPVVFNTFAGLMGWICIKNYEIACLNNYMDDYISISPSKETSQQTFILFQSIFAKNGWPLKDSKLVPPTQRTIHLGHEIDTQLMTVRLPEDRKIALIEELDRWAGSHSEPLKHWQSLAGWLIWCCVTCPHIRPFIQPLFFKISFKKYKHGKIGISRDVHFALKTIHRMLSTWNGIKLLAPIAWGPTETTSHVYVDATPDQIGAWYPELNQYSFYPIKTGTPIALAEACAALSAITYLIQQGNINNRKLVLFSDNTNVTDSIYKGYAKTAELNRYICCIVETCFWNKIELRCQYIPTTENKEADMLSRSDIAGFLKLHPLGVNVVQRPIHPSLPYASTNNGANVSTLRTARKSHQRPSRKSTSNSHHH